MKTTESKAEADVGLAAELTPVSYAAPTLARSAASRPEAVAYFVAHLMAVAAVTALGAVIALATISIAVLLAPLTLALLVGALRRHDRFIAARITA
jgi:hypothetical protein